MARKQKIRNAHLRMTMRVGQDCGQITRDDRTGESIMTMRQEERIGREVLQWRGNDFSTGWSRPTFSSWGSGDAVRPQRGPGQSPGGKRILTTIF